MTLVAQGMSKLGGAALAAAAGVLASARTAAKPLHPEGEVFAGSLTRCGAPAAPTGAPWVDEPGEDRVEVRLSRAIGLPDGLPDIHGLAIRVHQPDGLADLLFANTGTGRVGRYLLTASRRPRSRMMTTLLPYRTPTGPVTLAAESTDDRTYELSWARPSTGWLTFAVLRLEENLDDGTAISFDPVLHQVPGLGQYPSVLRLREPAYRRARRSRSADRSPR